MKTTPAHFQRNRQKWAVALLLARSAGRAWALPNTVLGALLGLLGNARWQLYQGMVEIVMRDGPVLRVCKKLGISAFTVGDCVLYAIEPDTRIRTHESRHCLQYWILGPFFLPTYFMMLALFGYFHHPLEEDARLYERHTCPSTPGESPTLSANRKKYPAWPRAKARALPRQEK